MSKESSCIYVGLWPKIRIMPMFYQKRKLSRKKNWRFGIIYRLVNVPVGIKYVPVGLY